MLSTLTYAKKRSDLNGNYFCQNKSCCQSNSRVSLISVSLLLLLLWLIMLKGFWSATIVQQRGVLAVAKCQITPKCQLLVQLNSLSLFNVTQHGTRAAADYITFLRDERTEIEGGGKKSGAKTLFKRARCHVRL